MPPILGTQRLKLPKTGSVIRYKKLPTILTNRLWVLIIPTYVSQLITATMIIHHM